MRIILKNSCPFCTRIVIGCTLWKISDVNLEYPNENERAQHVISGLKTFPAYVKDNGEYICDSEKILHILASRSSLQISKGQLDSDAILSCWRLVRDQERHNLSGASLNLLQRHLRDIIEYLDSNDCSTDISFVMSYPWIKYLSTYENNSKLNLLLQKLEL